MRWFNIVFSCNIVIQALCKNNNLIKWLKYLFLFLPSEKYTSIYVYIHNKNIRNTFYKLAVRTGISFGDLMHSIVIVNNTILYTWKLLRVDHKCFHHKKKWWLGDWMEVLANDIVIIILQYIRVSNQHTEYLKLTVSYVNYIYIFGFYRKTIS